MFDVDEIPSPFPLQMSLPELQFQLPVSHSPHHCHVTLPNGISRMEDVAAAGADLVLPSSQVHIDAPVSCQESCKSLPLAESQHSPPVIPEHVQESPPADSKPFTALEISKQLVLSVEPAVAFQVASSFACQSSKADEEKSVTCAEDIDHAVEVPPPPSPAQSFSSRDIQKTMRVDGNVRTCDASPDANAKSTAQVPSVIGTSPRSY
jgi:hypothetical protein